MGIEDFVSLEKLKVGCNRRGARYLKHDVYSASGPNDQPALLAEKYTAVDNEIYARLQILLNGSRLYATADDHREQYMGRRCTSCDKVVGLGVANCWSCGEKI